MNFLHQEAAFFSGILEFSGQDFPVKIGLIAAGGAVNDPGDGQINLSTVLIDQTNPFRLAFGNESTDKFTVVKVFDEFS